LRLEGIEAGKHMVEIKARDAAGNEVSVKERISLGTPKGKG